MHKTSVITFLAAPSLALSACQAHKEQAATGAASSPAVPVAALDFAQSNADAQVSLSLPEGIKAFPDLHTKLYNDGKTALDAFMAQAHKDRAQNSADGIDDTAYYHDIKWKITAQSPRLVSLYATEDDFEGGAHPNTTFQSVLWDKQTSTEVTPEKLLATGADLSGVDAYVCRQIEAERSKRNGAPTTQADSGFECPKFADSHLVLMASNVTGKIGAIDVLFAPYDVGSYAEGPYEIRVPEAELKGVISPDYADQFAGDATGQDALPDPDSQTAPAQ